MIYPNNGSITMREIEALNGRDMEVGMIQEVQTYCPELGLFPARTIAGTQFKATRIVALSTGGGFRKLNGGVKTGAPTLSQQKTECFPYSRLVTADPLLLQAGESDSEDQLKGDAQQLELQAGVIYLGQQTYYGTGFDSLGFPGLGVMVNPNLTLDAAAFSGVTLQSGDDGTLDCAFAVKFGPKFLHYVFGGDGHRTLQFGEWYKTLAIDPTDATKQLTKWASQLDLFMGLSNGSMYSVGAIFNLNPTPGYGGTRYVGLTDKMISAFERKYPIGHRPDAYLMTKWARGSLQDSRSVVTNVTGPRTSSGVELVAPIPATTQDGIPIYATDALLSTAVRGKYLTAIV